MTAPTSPPAADGGPFGLSNLIQGLTEEVLTYATPAIFERRRRILGVTRELIETRGYGDFTVKEICDRANVSTHTLYRAFESRERLIAVVIAVYVRDFHAQATRAFPDATLEDGLSRLILSARTMLSNPALSRALIAIHFSPTANETLHQVSGEKGPIIHDDWVRSFFHKGWLRRGITPARLVENLTNILFSVCWEWMRGSVDDAEFLRAQMNVMLTYAVGATRGAGQTLATQWLSDLLGAGARVVELEARVCQIA